MQGSEWYRKLKSSQGNNGAVGEVAKKRDSGRVAASIVTAILRGEGLCLAMLFFVVLLVCLDSGSTRCA